MRKSRTMVTSTSTGWPSRRPGLNRHCSAAKTACPVQAAGIQRSDDANVTQRAVTLNHRFQDHRALDARAHGLPVVGGPHFA
jgi:hypothetical protein